VLNQDFDYRLYLETLGNEGFNYTRIFTGTYIEPVENIFGIRQNTLAPVNGRFLAPWILENGKYDLDRFNPAYFSRLKDFITEAEQKGIIVEVTLFTSIYALNAWELSPLNSRNNSNGAGDLDFRRVNTLYNGPLKDYQEKFIRKMVRELNGFDNLFYEIQNEPWSDNGCLAAYVNEDDAEVFSQAWQKKVEVASAVSLEWQAWVASVIANEEAGLSRTHLLAQNICNYEVALDTLPDHVSILNFHYALPGAAIMNRGITGVTSLDETGFMPHHDSLYINQAWRIILAGAGIYNNLDYSFTAGHESGDWPIPDSNPGWGGPRFRKKLALLSETMAGIPFAGMEFTDGVLEPASGNLKQYGLAKPGEIYLVFAECSGDAELVPRVPEARYRVTYIDVGAGAQSMEEIKLGKGRTLQSPFPSQTLVIKIEKI
jgi:hypothetical protein